MPMEKKGQIAYFGTSRQVQRGCSASVHVTADHRECQGPLLSPEGHLPYEFSYKKALKTHVFATWVTKTQAPPLDLPSFGCRQAF